MAGRRFLSVVHGFGSGEDKDAGAKNHANPGRAKEQRLGPDAGGEWRKFEDGDAECVWRRGNPSNAEH